MTRLAVPWISPVFTVGGVIPPSAVTPPITAGIDRRNKAIRMVEDWAPQSTWQFSHAFEPFTRW